MRAVALVLALLVGAQCAAGQAGQYQGFIRASNLKFVDDNCKEFVPLGMNTYVEFRLPRCFSDPSLLRCTACHFCGTCRIVASQHTRCDAVVGPTVANPPCECCLADAALPSHRPLRQLCILQMASSRIVCRDLRSWGEPSHQPVWSRHGGVHHASSCQQQSDYCACICPRRQLQLGFAARARYAVEPC